MQASLIDGRRHLSKEKVLVYSYMHPDPQNHHDENVT
jgi:hypothetical protein